MKHLIASLILIGALGRKKEDPCPDWLLSSQKQYDTAMNSLVSQQHAGQMTVDQLATRLNDLKADLQQRQQKERCCCLDL